MKHKAHLESFASSISEQVKYKSKRHRVQRGTTTEPVIVSNRLVRPRLSAVRTTFSLETNTNFFLTGGAGMQVTLLTLLAL